MGHLFPDLPACGAIDRTHDGGRHDLTRDRARTVSLVHNRRVPPLRTPPTAHSAWPGRLALGLGIASAAGLGGVALWLAPLAQTAGRGAVAEQTAGLGAVLDTTWQRLRGDAVHWFGAHANGIGPVLEFRAEELGGFPTTSETQPPPEENAAVIAGLLRQAGADLRAGGDPARARATIESARELCTTAHGRAGVELAALRLAAAARDTAWVRELFERFDRDTPLDAREHGLPLRALGLLTAAPWIESERAVEAARRCLQDALDGVLPLPSSPKSEVDPRSRALVRRLGELAGDEHGERVLERLEAWARWSELRSLGPIPEDGAAWLGDGDTLWFVQRGAEGARARRLEREAFLGQLEAALRAQPLVDTELTVAAAGLAEAGALVTAPVRLDAVPFPIELRHPNLARWIAAEGAQVRLVQGSLFAVAALAALGGIAVAGLARRERRLAELRSRWIASVSHELRTPVAALSLAAERLERTREREPSRLPEYHRAIAAETSRLVRLVAEVMDLARLERGAAPALERQWLDPAVWLEQWLAGTRPGLAAQGFALEVEAGPLPPRAHFDGAALGRVLENLVRNAVEHGNYDRAPRPGGHTPTRRIGIAWRTEGDHWAIEVRDDGQGCRAEAKLFEPFERGAAAGSARGVGLGLGIARELVRAHGGELDFLKTPHGDLRGGAFRISLPMEPAHVETATEPPPSARKALR